MEGSDGWSEYRRLVVDTLANLDKRAMELEKAVHIMEQQTAFLKGAMALLAFLVGTGVLTTVAFLALQ